MKISLTAKKGILLFSLSAIIACGGGSNKETKNVENSQGGKEISASKETVDTGKEAKSYETELMERMNPIEEKVNKTIESGENMLAASFDLDEKWKKEYEKVYDLITSKLSASEKSKLESEEKEWFKKEEEKIKKELIDDGLEEGDRDYEMLFASNRAGLVKERTIELARKYDKLNK